MNRDLRAYLPAMLAVLFVALIGAQSLQALQRSGRWGGTRGARAGTVPADPYARLEEVLSAPDPAPRLQSVRDPFEYGHAPVAVRHSTGPVTSPPAPVSPRPVLTALISGQQDSRAVIAWQGRSYDVKSGDLFAEFRVVSVTADEVVLDSGRERIVLHRPTKGR